VYLSSSPRWIDLPKPVLKRVEANRAMLPAPQQQVRILFLQQLSSTVIWVPMPRGLFGSPAWHLLAA